MPINGTWSKINAHIGNPSSVRALDNNETRDPEISERADLLPRCEENRNEFGTFVFTCTKRVSGSFSASRASKC